MLKLLAIFLLLFFTTEVFSQDSLVEDQEKIVKYDTDPNLSPVQFEESIIENYKNNEDFNYVELAEEENWWTRFKRWLGNIWNQFWRWVFGDYEAGGIIAFFIKSLPYLIIAGIIAFVIWLFLKLNPGAKIFQSKEGPDVFFTEEEEIIKKKNIKKLIQKALEKKDFRLAVRYYYLFILKKLSESHIIEYEFDKTNSDYISEINSDEINVDFKKVTNLYDYIWYGSFDVTEEDYYKAQNTFTHLEHQIPDALE